MKALNKRKQQIIVFIDDLDRLTDQEIIDMMRAVKAIGDLPYVTYVLLYDPQVIRRALDTISHGKGEEYLEKIVQVSINLPEISPNIVHERIQKWLEDLTGTINKTDFGMTR